MSAYSTETIEWNQQAAEFLSLSSCDQEIYIAAVNAGGDPAIILDALARDGLLEAIVTSGADLGFFLSALPPDVLDLAAEAAISYVTGF